MTEARKTRRKLATIPLATRDQRTLRACCPHCGTEDTHDLVDVRGYVAGRQPDLALSCDACGRTWIDVERGDPELVD